MRFFSGLDNRQRELVELEAVINIMSDLVSRMQSARRALEDFSCLDSFEMSVHVPVKDNNNSESFVILNCHSLEDRQFNLSDYDFNDFVSHATDSSRDLSEKIYDFILPIQRSLLDLKEKYEILAEGCERVAQRQNKVFTKLSLGQAVQKFRESQVVDV